MSTGSDWSGQQLAEFLAAVSAYGDEAAAVAGAVERAAEAVEAEVGALVRSGEVVASVGFGRGRVPAAALVGATTSGARTLELEGLGTCFAVSSSLEKWPPSYLVVARRGDAFTQEEAVLLGAMARVLNLVLRMLRTLENERGAREQSEQQARENARLLASLQERQALLERLFRIQRSISSRAPIQEVLDAITEGAADLLGDEVVGLRLVDPEDPGASRLVSSVGIEPATRAALERAGVDQGLAASVMKAGRTVVTHDYAGSAQPLAPLVDMGLKAAMGAPVFQDGRPIGSLVVASANPARRFDAVEQEVLLAFAEHASLALNDASALEAMRKAFAAAVHQAHHDTLTGLPNRALVLDRLDHALAASHRYDRPVGVLFVDLDRFKVVNDSLGHSIGDEVLIRIGERLRSAVRPSDTVGRLAGDEFVVVCEDVDSNDLLRIAQRVTAAVEVPLSLYGRDAVITASIGIAHVAAGGRAEDVLRDADVAMYRAKERGRARVEIFDHAIRARLLQRLETEQALRRAVHRNELQLHYQPIVEVRSGRLTGVEALVRWAHPERGMVPPNDFIPLAEETGLIIPIGRWVLNEACAQLRRWQEGNPALAHLKVAINLSAREFTDPDLVGAIGAALDASSVHPSALSIEITESVLMEELGATAQTLEGLKRLGVGMSIDDFGTGYSSLSYLKRLPVDTLKIDRSFVDGLEADSDDQALVHAVVGLAHTLGLDVVAE
ncbi:MAG TPA: EAL domain-containing protein, partial [Acidimicrobiales bacterium]|nr:EAL domain-containing protein [Acidimicrobiales bacterium]